MDFDDVWQQPIEQSEDKESSVQNAPGHMYAPFQGIRPPLKKVQLLPLADEQPISSLPKLAFFSTPTPVTSIKPPPIVFADLWGDSTPSPEPAIHPLTNQQDNVADIAPNQPRQDQYLFVIEAEDVLHVERKGRKTIPLEWDEQWKTESATPAWETSEDWAEPAEMSLEDLDLFDIDAALAQQEASYQSTEYKRETDASPLKSRRDRWGGISSLIHVNWDDEEAAERDVLERLGYANIPLSKETRAFIIQAARNARLPHRQEVELTTQLANARVQLAFLPPLPKEEQEDPHTVRRLALQAEIAEIEQTLVCKMQWVGIKKATHFLGRGIELDDLIQIGMLGVIAGIKHFDITRKARLLVAVNMWVFQSLNRVIGDYGSIIRFPVYIVEQVRMLKKQHLQLQMTQGRLPTRQELAQAMEISFTQLSSILYGEAVLRASKQMLSLERYAQDEAANDGYSFQAIERKLVVSDDVVHFMVAEVDSQRTLQDVFQQLTAREQRVVSLRAGLDEDGDGESLTLEEIGKLLKVTRERVRQIEDRARRKIRGQFQKSHIRNEYPEIAAHLKTRTETEIKNVQKRRNEINAQRRKDEDDDQRWKEIEDERRRKEEEQERRRKEIEQKRKRMKMYSNDPEKSC